MGKGASWRVPGRCKNSFRFFLFGFALSAQRVQLLDGGWSFMLVPSRAECMAV